jgi:hypothetical protein
MLFTNGCNKLEALPLAGLSWLVLSLWVWLGANPRVDYSLPRTQRLVKDKHSSLLKSFINYLRIFYVNYPWYFIYSTAFFT